MKIPAALFVVSLFLWSAAGWHAAAAAATADPVSSVRLYAFDCGRIDFKDMSLFSDTGEYDGKSGSLVDPCFLIRHPKGILLWDTGLGDALFGRNDAANDAGVSVRVRARLLDQLRTLGIAPAKVTTTPAIKGTAFQPGDHSIPANRLSSSRLAKRAATYCWFSLRMFTAKD